MTFIMTLRMEKKHKFFQIYWNSIMLGNSITDKNIYGQSYLEHNFLMVPCSIR
jgi:hypothetical protein